MALYVSGTRPSALPRYGEPGRPPVAWWETPYGRWRGRAEVEAMRARFPEFTLTQPDVVTLRWEGWLWSSLDPSRSYQVLVTYPATFPDEAPDVRIAEPELPPDTPHMLVGRRPCLYYPTQGPRHGYDPARTTAATLVAWTALWIHAFETWQATGTWPGSEA